MTKYEEGGIHIMKITKNKKFVATGDYLVTRRVSTEDADFKIMQSLISNSDVSVTNLEVTVSNQEGTPEAFSGGTHLFTYPDRLEDLRHYGFNVVSCANNHCLDYGEDGLSYTMKYLQEYNIPFAGIGMNKGEARKPAYIDTENGRVAVLSICSSLLKQWFPENPRADMKGRPGANGLKFFNKLTLTPEHFDILEEIKKETQVNNLVDMMVDQDLMKLPDGMMSFGFDLYENPMLFSRGNESLTSSSLTTLVTKEVLDETIADIRNAKKASDYLIMNLHGHEMKAEEIGESADFHYQVAREWIDAGADAIVIHGCHQIRGIEIYKGKPIFYSLGNFIFQDTTVSATPQSFYDDNALYPEEGFNEIISRLAKNPNFLSSNILAMTSIMPVWETDGDNKLTSLLLYPLDLGLKTKPMYASGFPSLAKDEEIIKVTLDRMIELCNNIPQGRGVTIEKVTISITDDDGTTFNQVVGKVIL